MSTFYSCRKWSFEWDLINRTDNLKDVTSSNKQLPCMMKWKLYIISENRLLYTSAVVIVAGGGKFRSVGDLSASFSNAPTPPPPNRPTSQHHPANASSTNAPNHHHYYYYHYYYFIFEIPDRPNPGSFNCKDRWTIRHLARSISYTFPSQTSQKREPGVPSWAMYPPQLLGLSTAFVHSWGSMTWLMH